MDAVSVAVNELTVGFFYEGVDLFGLVLADYAKVYSNSKEGLQG